MSKNTHTINVSFTISSEASAYEVVQAIERELNEFANTGLGFATVDGEPGEQLTLDCESIKVSCTESGS